jgi:aminoglycoside 6'-N-acetyltransferase
MNLPLILRPATGADVSLLRRWDEEPHIKASNPNDDWNWEEELGVPSPGREQLIAELAGRAIGFIQIIDPAREASHYWGDCAENQRAIDIWIGEASCLGKGHGTAMMNLAIARCFAPLDVTGILIDPLKSNERARRFYERFGFKFVEDRHFGDDLCAVYFLSRQVWEMQPG